MFKKAKITRTNPTDKQMAAMAKETQRLIDAFRPIASLQIMINNHLKLVGAPDDMQIKSIGRMCKIFNWQNQGVIPYHYASEIVKIDAVKKAGFTIKSLRPDVNEWNVVE